MAGIKQEDIQPGDMKVWTDPFDRPGNQGLNLHHVRDTLFSKVTVLINPECFDSDPNLWLESVLLIQIRMDPHYL
jgi:hypothetical protein